MTKFAILTQATSYSASPGSEVIATKLEGGRSRLRADILNASTVVSTAWVFTAAQFNYFMAFFRTTTKSGSLPFTIDLIIDHAAKATYTANFVPDTVKIAGQSGDAYSVSADLEVEAAARDAVADASLVATYNAAHGA